MRELVAIVSPGGELEGVRDVLTDWSAVGILDPFIWITPSMIEETRVLALSVSDGELSACSVQSVVTGGQFDIVRLVILVPVAKDAELVKPRFEQRVAELLEASAAGASISRVRLAIVRAGDEKVTDSLAREAWHNVVLSPEQSTGPDRGHSLLSDADAPSRLVAHAAAGLAGLVGLWTGVVGAPLDQHSVLPGASAMLARSFYRRLQGDALESELRARVTTTTDSLPLPTEGGRSSVYVEDTTLATSTMAAALWARHQAVLRGPRETARAAVVKPIGVGAALKLFFSFLAATIRNAPQQWYRRTVVQVSSRVAGAVHGMVFGTDPAAYSVVVNGITSNGLPASWLDLGDAAKSLDKLLDEPGEKREHQASVDLSDLWSEFAAATLTLADGGERVTGLSPVTIGTQTAVLRTVEECVPSPQTRFTDMPGHIAAQVEVSSVDAFDVLAVNNLHQRLVALQNGDVGLGLDAGRAIDALGEWTSRFKANFAVKVGSTLAGSIVQTAAEVRSLLESLKSASDSESLSQAVITRQKRLAALLRVFGIVLVVLLVVVGILAGVGVVTLLVAAIIAMSTVIAWFVASIVAFFRGQRDLFRLLNARQQLTEQAELLKRNLRQAIRDLRRLTDAYSQYLAWSRVLGVVLTAPLGVVAPTKEDAARLSPELPLNVVLGSAVMNEATMSNAVITLRRQIFREGWLTAPWNSLVSSVATMIGADAYQLSQDRNAIFKQPGSGNGSLLLRWAEILEAKGVDASIANEMWQSVRVQLDGPLRHIAADLLGSIVQLGKPTPLGQPFADFMAKVDDTASVSGAGRFDLAALTTHGQSIGVAAVDSTWGAQQRLGLSRIAVLTQLSQGAPAYEYAAFAPSAAQPIQTTLATDAVDGDVAAGDYGNLVF